MVWIRTKTVLGQPVRYLGNEIKYPKVLSEFGFSDKKNHYPHLFCHIRNKKYIFFHILYIFYPNEKNIYPNRFRIKNSSSLARPKNIRSFKREIYGPYFMNHTQWVILDCREIQKWAVQRQRLVDIKEGFWYK